MRGLFDKLFAIVFLFSVFSLPKNKNAIYARTRFERTRIPHRLQYYYYNNVIVTMRRRYNMVYHTIDVIIRNEFFLFFYIILMKNRFYYNETNAYNITTVCVHVRVYIYIYNVHRRIFRISASTLKFASQRIIKRLFFFLSRTKIGKGENFFFFT